MINNVKNVWKMFGETLGYEGGGILRNEVEIDFLKNYFNDSFFVPYKRGTRVGINDPETYKSLFWEVGDWYGPRSEWKRNKRGKHILFRFWNHGNSSNIIKHELLVKEFKRTEGKRIISHVIYNRNKNIEEGVMYRGKENFELGTGYRTNYIFVVRHPMYPKSDKSDINKMVERQYYSLLNVNNGKITLTDANIILKERGYKNTITISQRGYIRSSNIITKEQYENRYLIPGRFIRQL